MSGEIVCSDLTLDDVGDPTALPDMLDQVDAPVEQFLADGAYDGTPTGLVAWMSFCQMLFLFTGMRRLFDAP